MNLTKKVALLVMVFMAIIACQNEETLILEDQASEALELDIDLVQYQNTPSGLYKGVFSTADSQERGVVRIEVLEETNSRAVITYVNGQSEELTGTVMESAEQNSKTVDFTSNTSSFKFTVNADGTSPVITDVIKNSKPSFITVIKENTRDAVSMFTGTFETDAMSAGTTTGTWSIVFDNGDGDADVATTAITTQIIFNGADVADTQTNEQMACAIRGRKGDCPIGGTIATPAGNSITWSGTHTYRDDFDCSSARGTWSTDNGWSGTYAPDTDCHGTGEIIITEIHNRPQRPTQAQLDAAFVADPTNPMNDLDPDEDHVEWFEIYNPTAAAVVMDGWLISDGSGGGDQSGDGGTTTIDTFTLGAGEYAVFSGFNIPDAQGGIVFDYRHDYQRPSFNNESSYADVGDSACPDGVLLYKPNGMVDDTGNALFDLVDEVLYDYGFSNYIAAATSSRCNNSTDARGLPAPGSPSRTSFQLINNPAVMNAVDNDSGANWTYSTNVYDDNSNTVGASDQIGTPGTANDM